MTTTTTAPATTSTTAPKQTLPPISIEALPVPSGYTCSSGLYPLASANAATEECVPYAYLVGGTVSEPDNDTACPPGSFMTMGPVECEARAGLVAAVPPGPGTCSQPGGPCPSARLPLSPSSSVIPWASISFPTGQCPSAYYFGESNGTATCVPYRYLPGGTSSEPNNDTACSARSALKPIKLTGTLCTQEVAPFDIVAPVPPPS